MIERGQTVSPRPRQDSKFPAVSHRQPRAPPPTVPASKGGTSNAPTGHSNTRVADMIEFFPTARGCVAGPIIQNHLIIRHSNHGNDATGCPLLEFPGAMTTSEGKDDLTPTSVCTSGGFPAPFRPCRVRRSELAHIERPSHGGRCCHAPPIRQMVDPRN